MALALDDCRHHLRVDEIGNGGDKKRRRNFVRSRTDRTRAKPCAAPNSPPVIATTAVSPRASWLAELLMLNVVRRPPWRRWARIWG